MATTGNAPLQFVMDAYVLPQATAGADTETVIGEVPYAATVTLVEFIPLAAITGAATNNRTHSVTDRGAAGAGNTQVASLNYAAGVNAAQYASKQITLSGTPANLQVAAGDVLTFDSLHVGTGIADPGGRVRVTLTRN